MARTLAQQVGPQVEAATQPFQFALSTRAGTDAAGLLLRATSEIDPQCVIMAIDGIGAFDNISRSAMLSKLCSLPGASALLPFVRMFYTHPSEYLWEDAARVQHRIVQGEGGEQGDALMPMLYSLGQHEGLVAARAQLPPPDGVIADLDDIYLITRREHARASFDLVTQCVRDHCGVDVNMGKCRAWSRAGGPPPPGFCELGRMCGEA